ncbi:hypothetical protein QBC34DRAFT_388366 [Podospora aff. communis PSN243]|uniref:DUF7907 domain-containing protein n=1 Tax=Podospora aff. communis PSN243 TaxID=3040156 RepID=A0AAV9H663_9PEZI|nr:hypothetical protein QBC34DRAFT_388366 [Podospora aff. communis PSN243]
MKTVFTSAALAVLAGSTTVAAQRNFPADLKAGARFYLQLSAPDNSSIDGLFLKACHTGAGRSTLCVSDLRPPFPRPEEGIFYLNYTNDANQGILINEKDVFDVEEQRRYLLPLPFSLVLSTDTNVAMTLVAAEDVDYRTLPKVKLTADGLSIPVTVDDSKFREGILPIPISYDDASRWYTCWVLSIPYYYEALAWVTGLVPRNPTCRSVKVVTVDAVAYHAQNQSAAPVIPDPGMMPEVIPKPGLDGQDNRTNHDDEGSEDEDGDDEESEDEDSDDE